MAAKPQRVESMPRLMFSSPMLGPTVRSSIMSIGAASAPARSSNEMSVASCVLFMPEICTRPPPISSLITGAVITSAWPFSINKIAMRLPTLSLVTCLKIRAPRPSSVTLTVDRPLCWSAPGPASVMYSPVSSTFFFTRIGWPLRSIKNSSPNGVWPLLACSRVVGSLFSSSTKRISSVAVRPRISLAFAVSCTPGS